MEGLGPISGIVWVKPHPENFVSVFAGDDNSFGFVLWLSMYVSFWLARIGHRVPPGGCFFI